MLRTTLTRSEKQAFDKWFKETHKEVLKTATREEKSKIKNMAKQFYLIALSPQFSRK